MPLDHKIVISTRTIFITFLALLSFWLLYQIKTVIILLFVSLILTLLLDPFVDRIQEKKIPRGVAVFIVYLVFLTIFGFLIIYGFSPMVEQTRKLLMGLPILLDQVLRFVGLEDSGGQIFNALSNNLATTSGSVFKVTWGVFTNIISLITVLVLTYYFLLDFDHLKKQFIDLFSKDDRKKLEKLVDTLEFRLGGWLRGQILLMIVVGIAVYVGLMLLKVPYALSLGLIAGLLEIVPIIGPVISAIPAVIVALAVSPLLALGVAALYFLVQQLENNIIVPKVMQKAVGFNPLITMLVLLVGGKLFGGVGVVLAVPVTLSVYLVVQSLLDWEIRL